MHYSGWIIRTADKECLLKSQFPSPTFTKFTKLKNNSEIKHKFKCSLNTRDKLQQPGSCFAPCLQTAELTDLITN